MPGKKTLTQASVRQIEIPAATRDVHDAKVVGLVVRVRPSGNKTWLVRLKDEATGAWYWWTLGSADAIPPEAARLQARRWIGEAAAGRDPRTAKREAKQRAAAKIALGKFLADHYGPWVVEHRKTGDETVKRIESVFADLLPVAITDLSSFAVEKWRTARLKAGTRPATVNRDIAALRACLSRAVEWGWLPHHPLRAVKPTRVDSRGVVRYLTPEEDSRLRHALTSRDDERRAARDGANAWRHERDYRLLPKHGTYTDILTPLVMIALHTGLRFGELANLRWQDVSLTGTNPILTVRGDGAKSGLTRHLPLNQIAVETLSAWRPRKAAPDAYVFPGKDGGRLVEVKTAWRNLMRRATIEDFRFHDLRHTFASRLVQAGVDLNAVRELLGHSDIGMTLRYAHLAPDNRREAVDRLVG